jgi:hypothetical protein
MTFSPSFFRAAAVCSLISAITTLLLIFLPSWYAPAEGFNGRMARVNDPAYVWRSWVYLLHPFLVLMAALGMTVRIRPQAPGAALVGFLGFVLWGFTEAAQQTLTLFAFDRWRVAYLAADEALRAQIRIQVAVYDGLWDALYVLLLLGFALGNLLLGIALVRQAGFSRIVGAFLLAAFFLTLTILSGEVGGPTLPGPLDRWTYPAIQPLGRTLIALWLFRAAQQPGSGAREAMP